MRPDPTGPFRFLGLFYAAVLAAAAVAWAIHAATTPPAPEIHLELSAR